jgi:type IV pilus assembly protein PilZ
VLVSTWRVERAGGRVVGVSEMARPSTQHAPPPPELASGELPSPANRIAVDCASGETFLFVYVANASDLGIFVPSEAPLPVGTGLRVGFEGIGEEGTDLTLDGEVAWVNPLKNGDNANPGMGIRFVALSREDRELVVSYVRAIAYLDEPLDAN